MIKFLPVSVVIFLTECNQYMTWLSEATSKHRPIAGWWPNKSGLKWIIRRNYSFSKTHQYKSLSFKHTYKRIPGHNQERFLDDLKKKERLNKLHLFIISKIKFVKNFLEFIPDSIKILQHFTSAEVLKNNDLIDI